MSNRYDERKCNIQKIKNDIENTQANIEFASEIIESIDDEKIKKSLKEQNERRKDSIDSMIEDVKEKVFD